MVFRSLKFTDGGGAGEGRQIEPGRGEAGDGHGDEVFHGAAVVRLAGRPVGVDERSAGGRPQPAALGGRVRTRRPPNGRGGGRGGRRVGQVGAGDEPHQTTLLGGRLQRHQLHGTRAAEARRLRHVQLWRNTWPSSAGTILCCPYHVS